jgi:quinol monooxygenase YgiN
MKQSKILTMMTLIALLGYTTQTFSNSNNYKMENNTKEQIGLLVILNAKPGKEEAVRDFLLGGLPLVNDEPGTESWYAFQIDNNTFGIFDTFRMEEGRQAHLKGEVAKALLANADDLLVDFNVSVSIQPVNLLAAKLSSGDERKGLLVMMKAKEGKTSEVENFLRAGKNLVNDEPKTVSWYAIQINKDTYAIFDTFSEDEGRYAHLNGKVAAALIANAPAILEDFDAQAIQRIDILASK